MEENLNGEGRNKDENVIQKKYVIICIGKIDTDFLMYCNVI